MEPPLDVHALRAELAGAVTQLEVVDHTGSTNADLAQAADRGAPDGTVLVAELQQAGRGRLDRTWTSPRGAGLTFSVLLRPTEVPPTRLGLLPLLAGLSLVRTVREYGVDAVLKWPNDLLTGLGRAKCAGLLAEVPRPGVVVLGIGLNVRTSPEQLAELAARFPQARVTSLLVEGVDVRRDELFVALLRRLLADQADWRAAGGDPVAGGLLSDYRAACATLGGRVRVEQPRGTAIEGTAVDIDGEGRLLVRGEDGVVRAVAAGDVVHVRERPVGG